MSNLYEKIIRPAMFRLDAETAHELAIESLRHSLASEFAQRMAARQFGSPEFEHLERFGLKFSNPLGVAAGFDKNGLVVNQLASLGFGFVEVGTVTFRAQKGNEKPRLFRLPEDKALINRLGFNNDGAEVVAARLKKLRRHCVVGVNIGRNKDIPNEEAVENYLASFDLVHGVADYIAINISSPNTPNLRELQKGENLEELLKAIQHRNRILGAEDGPPEGGTQNLEASGGGTQNLKPLLVKIAPDLDDNEIAAIVDTCIRHGIAGIIATNTTTSRENLTTPGVEKIGPGGLSGCPIADRSNEVISAVFRYSKGKLPIVGVGGIFTAADAFDKIGSGACLLQAYTGFVYCGAGFAPAINKGLLEILQLNGFSSLDEAIGCMVRP